MELPAGVFVSSTSADDWAPDPDVPGSAMHELVHADGVWAGMSRFTDQWMALRSRVWNSVRWKSSGAPREV